MIIDKFIEKYSNCRACVLCENRTQVVFGRGTMPAPLLIIGEAPGQDEDKQGKPFVGRSGKLLDRLLKEMDVQDYEFYITNVCLCRPPDNRDPLPEEIEACRQRLSEHVEMIDPKVILALGRFAAQALSGSKEKITQLRTHNGLYYEGIPMVAEFHPSYSLHNGNKFDSDIAQGILKATKYYW